jgi:hypothetical protein
MKGKRVTVVCDSLDISSLKEGLAKELLEDIPSNGEPISCLLLENGSLFIDPLEFTSLDNTDTQSEQGFYYSFRILPTDGTEYEDVEIDLEYEDELGLSEEQEDSEYINDMAEAVKDMIVKRDFKKAITLIMTLL